MRSRFTSPLYSLYSRFFPSLSSMIVNWQPNFVRISRPTATSARDARSPRLFLKLGVNEFSLKKYPSQFGGELLFIAANTVSGFIGSSSRENLSFSHVAEWLSRLTTKEPISVRSQKYSLSGPALQERKLSQSFRAVDEIKPEGPLGALLGDKLCSAVN